MPTSTRSCGCRCKTRRSAPLWPSHNPDRTCTKWSAFVGGTGFGSVARVGLRWLAADVSPQRPCRKDAAWSASGGAST